MAKLVWDQTGEKQFHLGVSKTVLYPQTKGTYPKGIAWSGVTGITASPDGADNNKKYADNILYASIRGVEDFGMTIKAYMYPPEWAECDGSKTVAPGVYIGQQNRTPFGLSWQSLIGDDANGEESGYIIHLVWGATAKPSDQDYETVNDNPDLIEFSWECETAPVDVPGFKPTAHMEINSLLVDGAKLEALEKKLYGDTTTGASLPTPEEVINMLKAS